MIDLNYSSRALHREPGFDITRAIYCGDTENERRKVLLTCIHAYPWNKSTFRFYFVHGAIISRWIWGWEVCDTFPQKFLRRLHKLLHFFPNMSLIYELDLKPGFERLFPPAVISVGSTGATQLFRHSGDSKIHKFVPCLAKKLIMRIFRLGWAATDAVKAGPWI
jgi:hypothetical protein